MATLVTRYVNTGSTAGGDGTTNATTGANRAYATLAAAATAIAAAYPNFVTSDVQVDLYCSGATADTAETLISGITTDATRYLRVLAASGQEALASGWDTGRYRLSVTNPSGQLYSLIVSLAHIRVIGLQIELVGTAGLNSRTAFLINSTYSATNFIQVDRCRVRYTATSVGTDCIALSWASSGNRPRISNTIIETVGTQRTSVTPLAINSNDDGAIYNCLMTGGAKAFSIGGDAGRPIFKNCALYNNTADTTAGDWHASSTNNASDRADVVGSNQRESQTFAFENAATGDYRLTGADAAARDFGIDLSADGVLAVTTDIVGTTRSGSWDIGPFEYVAVVVNSLPAQVGLSVTGTGLKPYSAVVWLVPDRKVFATVGASPQRYQLTLSGPTVGADQLLRRQLQVLTGAAAHERCTVVDCTDTGVVVLSPPLTVAPQPGDRVVVL